MKLAVLTGRNSIHTVRWVNSLVERDLQVDLISSHVGGDPLDERVKFHKLSVPAPLGYFLNGFELRSILKKINPDLLHTHQVSGYGTLGRLSRFSPQILSAWGSDVFDFPEVSPIHRCIAKQNLKKADWVCSTSHIMAQRTKEVYPVKHMSVTPFGIDTDRFISNGKLIDGEDKITIGTVKTLKPKYGIDILVNSFAKLQKTLNKDLADKLRLLIVGGGPQEDELRALTRKLNIDKLTKFTGRVSHEVVPKYLNKLDIYVALSRLDSESFGVAILEASSCGLPVVVSNVGGLPEVVEDGKTGLIVNSESPESAADAIRELVLNQEKRKLMGNEGREHVLQNYRWEKSVDIMLSVYETVLNKHSN